MAASTANTPLRLALSDDPLGQAEPASWIGPLVALGARASRFNIQSHGRQLILAISVPRRDFAAALIGCGWVMASPEPKRTDPLEVLRGLQPHTPVRVVTSREVIADYFTRLNETTSPPRAHVGGSQWQVPGIRAVEVLEDLPRSARTPRPSPGALGRLARVEESWDTRLASPEADLAIVGTLNWLREELDALVSREDEGAIPNYPAWGNDAKNVGTGQDVGSLGNVLLPHGPKVATWFTRLYAGAKFADQFPIPDDVRAIVLDGAGAIKYLSQIEVPVVVCVLDRSVADETAAEIVVQLRNSRGEPVSLREELEWTPPAGVEALAFTVAL
ncbi:hypothetical protein SAMN06295973_2520 [Plantibacter cousiniae]|uniref:Uncharacterized protein n=1 Tax=Plantibacter cousiniae (nom. nud.) TaxID=199709 RepID=A0ABY1LNG0_9MICO|nr:hypothetical protein SAMN06295973_2520 [Plantibacter cousiniae]